MRDAKQHDYVREGIEFYQRLPLIPPQQVFSELEEFGYRGQEEARRSLSLMAYRHVKRLKKIYQEGLPRHDLPLKSNYLLIGPTGCGKTHLVELLFKTILKIPTVIVDMTEFSETGYVGDDTRTILTRLMTMANQNPVVASGGIVCLDEFDKLASGQNSARFDGQGTTKDVSGMGVQRELLKIMEAAEVMVPTDFNNTVFSPRQALYTGDISFIAAGAFSGFKLTITARSKEPRIGFDAPNRIVDRSTIAVRFEDAEVGDIENFQHHGFLPELLGRFTRIVPLPPLDRDTLSSILRDNVVKRFIAEFHDEGLELVIEAPVFEHIIDVALKRQTGARGLSAILTQYIEDLAYKTFREYSGRVRLRMDGHQVVHEIG